MTDHDKHLADTYSIHQLLDLFESHKYLFEYKPRLCRNPSWLLIERSGRKWSAVEYRNRTAAIEAASFSYPVLYTISKLRPDSIQAFTWMLNRPIRASIKLTDLTFVQTL